MKSNLILEKEFSMKSKIENGEGNELSMHYGAGPLLFKRAEELRARMTPAEEIFWNIIKVNEWNLKFRRQHPLSNYIADFYCHSLKLVIELDGGYHENQDVKIFDAAREAHINEFGITVLRFKNGEVINDIEKVLKTVQDTINTIPAKEAEMSNNSPFGTSRSFREGAGAKLFVIKIGGNVIDDEIALNNFLKDFATIPGKKILIHGGGKIATKIGEQLGIAPNYINGRRITDAATIDLVTMVYGGLVNKKIVAKLQSLQCNAIGLTGADANLIPAIKRPVKDINYGFVGDIDNGKLKADTWKLLLENGLIPVITPLTHDGNGQMLNTNADTIAATIATVLSDMYDVRLIYCFEKKGVLENVEDENSVINLITKEKYKALTASGKLFEGILPKIDNAFAAIDSGVKEVLIGDAKDLLQNCGSTVKGTLFT
jgi:acetylglutamate kinase